MPSYWVVGAMGGGRDDRLPEFLERRCWYGYRGVSEPAIQAKRRMQVREGDRIAIKKNIGLPGGGWAEEIEIRAVGIVTRASTPEDPTLGVDWKRWDLCLRVPSRGCYATLNPPFPREGKDDRAWIAHAFAGCL